MHIETNEGSRLIRMEYLYLVSRDPIYLSKGVVSDLAAIASANVPCLERDRASDVSQVTAAPALIGAYYIEFCLHSTAARHVCPISHCEVHYSYRKAAISVFDAIDAGWDGDTRFGDVINLQNLWLTREIHNELISFIDILDPALRASSSLEHEAKRQWHKLFHFPDYPRI